MSTSGKYAKLVNRLFDRTSTGKLDWSLVNGQPACVLGEFTVLLSSARSAEGEPFEFVELLDAHQHSVEKFSDADVKGEHLDENDHDGSYYWKMTSLREAAYRNAVGADAAIDSVLNELD